MLEEISVNCTAWPRFCDPPSLEPVKFTSLDEMIAERGGLPLRLCWRIAAQEEELARCGIQRAFSRVHALGMLVVERHFSGAGDREWMRWRDRSLD